MVDAGWDSLVTRGRAAVAELRAGDVARGKIVLQVEAEYGPAGVQRMAWFNVSGEQDLSKMSKRGWRRTLALQALAEEMSVLDGCKREALKVLLGEGDMSHV